MLHLDQISPVKKTVAFFAVIFGCLAITVIGAPTANAYNGARLIDDSILRDYKSMSISKIQSFLNNMNSGIKDKTFTFDCNLAGSQSKQLYLDAGAPCGKKASSATIIYYASRIYGINPKVVLATMQKEQSLITTTNPTSWQINQAMGYGCPTDGSCDDDSGFFYQVDNGTWVLRWHYERARGNNDWWRTTTSWTCGSEKNYYKPSLYPNSNTTFYDGNGVAYRKHNLLTAATSALYCYTPHAYNNPDGLYGLPVYGTKGQYYTGSYNFVKSFEAWFGSTQGTPFFRIGNTAPVYILGEGSTYYQIPSMDILEAYGYGKNIKSVAVESSVHINGLTLAGNLGLTAKFESAPVYLMDSGGRHHFTSSELLVNVYGYSTDEVSRLPQQLEFYFTIAPTVKTVVKERGGKPIYFIENGKKRHIADGAALNSGDPTYSSLSSMELSKSYISTLPNGSMIFAPGTLYRIGSTPAVYLVNDFDQSLRIPSKSIFDHFNFNAKGVRSVTSSQVTGYPVSGDLGHFVRGGNLWLIHGGTYRNHVTEDPMASESKYALTVEELPYLRSELIRVYDGRSDLRSDLIRADGDAKVYLIENGTKRWITSKSTLDSYGGSSKVTSLSEIFVDSIPSGSNIN